MTDTPAARIIAALDDPAGWLITQAGLDQLREVAAREHDFEAVMRYRGQNDAPLSFRGPDPSVAVLDIRGAMTRRASMFSDVSGLSSTDALSDEFARLEADPDVQAVLMRFDTPGGQVSGLAEFAERIYSASTRTVAYASDMAASAGYWLASQADEIIVSPTAIIGSIGVRGRAPDAPRDGEMVSRHAPAKLGDRAASQAALDRLEEEFHATIARGRGVSAEHVAAHFGQGGIFIGSDAVNAGLADRVSTFDSVLSGLSAGEPPRRKATTQETRMGTENDQGGITAADYEAAVKAARNDGHLAGKEEAESAAVAALEAAVAQENERLVAIMTAAEGKPLASVLPIAKNRAIDAQAAVEIIAGFPDAKRSGGLNGAMAGTNPDITNDEPAAADDADASAAVWAAIRGDK